jgi:ankyrin repeat protein
MRARARHVLLVAALALVSSCAKRTEPVRITAMSEGRVTRGLNAGASPSNPDHEGVPPLIRATTQGRFDLVRLLVARGAPIDDRDAFGRTALHRAAERGEIEIMDWLIHSGADVAAQTYPEGDTPAHMAAGQRCYACLDMLLVAGAKIDAKNALDQTPLHASTLADGRYGAHQIEWLLDHGADPAARDARGFAVAHYAAWMNNAAVLDVLHKRGVPVDEPTTAGIRPVDTAAWALAGISLRWFATHGITSSRYPIEDPLESAAKRNDASAMSWLLAREPRRGPSGLPASQKLLDLAEQSNAKSAERALKILGSSTKAHDDAAKP